MEFKKFILLNEKITPLMGWETKSLEWIKNVYEYAKVNQTLFFTAWKKLGGYSDAGFFHFPKELQKEMDFDLPVKTFDTPTTKGGVLRMYEMGNKVELLVPWGMDKLPFEEIVGIFTHEFSHIANFLTKRKYGSLSGKGMSRFVGSDSTDSPENLITYYKHPGEIDANARTLSDEYKRKFPEQSFSMKNFLSIKSDIITIYQELLKWQPHSWAAKKFFSKVASSI